MHENVQLSHPETPPGRFLPLVRMATNCEEVCLTVIAIGILSAGAWRRVGGESGVTGQGMACRA